MDSQLKISIIIPVHNQFNLLDRCLQSIINCTTYEYEIILSDSNSDRELSKYYTNFDFTSKLKPDQLKIVRDDINPGFSRAVNNGMRIASQDSDYYVWLNSDTVVTPSWLTDIKKCDLCSPLSNNATYQSIYPIDLKDLHWINEFLNFKRRKQTLSVDLLNGFCYIMSKDVYEKVGFLDEKHFPHYGSEDDYSLRAKLLGFQAKILVNSFVFHHGNRSYKEDILSDLRRNDKIFLSKYPEKWFNDIVFKHKIKMRNLRCKLIEEFIDFVEKKTNTNY